MVDASSPKRRHSSLQVQRCLLVREGGNAPQQTRNNTREDHLSNTIRENLRFNIINLYGEETFHRTRCYERLSCKRGDLLCDLAFLLRCRDNNVLPTFTKLSYHQDSPKIRRILQHASRALLREEIHRVRSHLDQTDKNLLPLHMELSNIIHPTLWFQVDSMVHWRVENNTNLRRQRQMNKYTGLERRQRPQRSPQLSAQRVVRNISDYQLTEADTKVLSKGFNFAVAPRSLPQEEIISAVESALQNVDSDDADTVRENVAHLLRNSRPPRPNLSREEHQAIKNLRANKDIIILPADKGNATVIMNTADYHRKMEVLLDDPAYKKINTDPTTYLEKTTRKKILDSPIDPDLRKQLVPRERSSRCPKLYGLPKIHKPGIPPRPIVSSIGSPVQNLARYLAQYINNNTEEPDSHVRNSSHFVEILRNTRVLPGDLLVSFDIVSLFTNIPIEEALDIISMNNDFPPHIIELTAHCLHNTYFIYQGQRYRQVEGAPMGSPLSPIIADKFMEDFEKKALQSAPHTPSLWIRYVDDTFVIWRHGEQELNVFLQHLNSIHPKIQFTMEMEKDGKLPFLDVQVYRKPNGELGHTVYRKPTHTNRYLQASSHHHPAQLHGVVKTLVDRSKRIADNDNKLAELTQLRAALQANGYSTALINRTINNRNEPREQPAETQHQQLAILPYVQGVTDKIGNILRRYDIKPVFKPLRTLSMMMNNPKDKIPLENHGVYSIPCKGCEKVYIGETSQRISARREEHKRCITRKVPTSSLFQHVQETRHDIDFDGTRQLANIEHHRTRKIREAIEIETRPNLNQRNDSLNLPIAWKTCLRIRDRNQEIQNQHLREIGDQPPVIAGPAGVAREVSSTQARNQSSVRTRRQVRQTPPVIIGPARVVGEVEKHQARDEPSAHDTRRYNLRPRINRTVVAPSAHSSLDNGGC